MAQTAVECYSAFAREEVLPQATGRVNLEDTTPRETSRSLHASPHMSHLEQSSHKGRRQKGGYQEQGAGGKGTGSVGTAFENG